MIGGKSSQFIDRIYTCQDTVYIYRGVKYWFQGYTMENQTVHMEIFQYQPPGKGFVWEYSGANIEECVTAFLEARIFNGKTFWDAEQDINWIDDD